MSRTLGNFPFAANFEPQLAGPLDARVVVDTLSNLTLPAYWQSTDSQIYLYKGITVSVWNDIDDNKGIYILIADDYTNINNWYKIGGETITLGNANTDPIRFDKKYIYNAFDAPANNNITHNLTGAKIGNIQKIYHLQAVGEPTFPASWVLLGDGIYMTNQLNIIYCEWSGDNRVEYWITQEQ